jgi:hypothetical protein
VVKWEIVDVGHNDPKKIDETIKHIITHVDKLALELKNRYGLNFE